MPTSPTAQNTEHTPIQSGRLDLVDDILIASGWANEPDGWLAPKHFREQLAREFGNGHVRRSIAIAAQVQVDEAVIKAKASHGAAA